LREGKHPWESKRERKNASVRLLLKNWKHSMTREEEKSSKGPTRLDCQNKK